MADEISELPVPRRRFLAVCVKAGLAAVGFVAVAFGIGFFFPSTRRWFGISAAPFQAICAVAGLPSGKWKLVNFDTLQGGGPKSVKRPHTVWVRRDGDGSDAIRVLSPICPHNGCAINWRPDRAAFICPCHGGTFDANGQLKSGPPRRSMDPVAFRIEKGQLLVQWQDTETG